MHFKYALAGASQMKLWTSTSKCFPDLIVKPFFNKQFNSSINGLRNILKGFGLLFPQKTEITNGLLEEIFLINPKIGQS